jgi:phosphopantothenoylcysteine decarboxylase/phosphopantothenate--cysteine ligase
LDPVRFLGNRSTGKQGVALAAAAAARGAAVTLIGANLEVTPPTGVTSVPVSSTLELEAAVGEHAAAADLVIMAAAVADYRPEQVEDRKITKEERGDRLEMVLVRNPDILRGLVERRTPGQVIVGFAAETEPDRERLLERGRAKIARKGCDYLVVNQVGWHEGFGTEANHVVMLDLAGDIVGEADGDKRSVADRILDVLSLRPR